MLNNHNFCTSLSFKDFKFCEILSTNSTLYTNLHSIKCVCRFTYLELAWLDFMFRFKSPNNYSIGFSQGEYYALKRTLTLNALHVSRTWECLCITALSMNTNTFIFEVAMLLRTLWRVRYTKLSKRVESTPPSIIWEAIILD